MTNNKLNSKLKDIVINYDDYSYVRILDKKTNKPIEIIERLNLKNIYIYFFEKSEYETIIFYNKSNKVYRIIIRFDKSSNDFYIINDFLDLKMKEYFNIDNIILYNKLSHIEINTYDLNYFDFIKKIDA
jgi:hypothetical protein